MEYHRGRLGIRQVDLSAFPVEKKDVPVWVFSDQEQAGQPNVTNSFDHPQRITTASSTLTGTGPLFEHRFPALSLTVFQWRVSPHN